MNSLENFYQIKKMMIMIVSYYIQKLCHFMKEITYDEKICVHSGKCVKNLPFLFQIKDGKFVIIQDGAPEEEIRNTVNMCQSKDLNIVDINSYDPI